MKVYIMRHGIAVELGERGTAHDEERMLSGQGVKRTQLVAGCLGYMGVSPHTVLSSPLLRARETAEILAAKLKSKKKNYKIDALMPGGSHQDTLTLLAEMRDDVMVVGHMPDLAQLTSLLLTGQAGIEVQFKKAGVACLTFDGPVEAGAGRLDWLIQPRTFLKTLE